MVLKFADHAALKKKGRNFDCSECIAAVAKRRRCKEDREDFTVKDGTIWPIRIEGHKFSFCPGKATWCESTAEAFRLIETTYFMRSPLFPGSFFEQPWWYGEIIDEMLPLYESHREAAKNRQLWGSGDGKTGQNSKNAKKQGGKSQPNQKMRRG